MKLKQFANGGLRRMRPNQRATGHLHKLGGNPQLLADLQQGTGQNKIHFRFFGDSLEIQGIRRVLRRNYRGTHGQILQASQGDGDGLGKAERQKLDVFVGPQEAKGKNDDPSQGARLRFGFNPVHQERRAQLCGHGLCTRAALSWIPRQRRMHDPAHGGDCRGAGKPGRGNVQNGVRNFTE